jgi:hypothetical protein
MKPVFEVMNPCNRKPPHVKSNQMHDSTHRREKKQQNEDGGNRKVRSELVWFLYHTTYEYELDSIFFISRIL